MNTDLISQAAAALRDASIRELNSLYVRAATTETLRISGPPLKTDSSVAGVDLAPLARLTYTDDDDTRFDMERVYEAFQVCASARNGHKAASKAIHAAVRAASATVPLKAPTGVSILSEMVQLFQVATWFGHQAEFEPKRAALHTLRGPLVLHAQAIDGLGSYWRLKHAIGFDYRTALTCPIGPSRTTSGAFGGLFRHLCEVFPDDVTGLGHLFAAASYSGQEDLLTKAFDIEIVWRATSAAGAKAIRRAILFLDQAVGREMPYDRLKAQLKGLDDKLTFIEMFGLPADYAGRPYLRSSFEQHRVHLLRMESEVIRGQKVEQPKTPSNVKAAVDLTRIIR